MGVDVLDLTVLQKRGLLKQHVSEQDNPDVLDLTLPASRTNLPASSAQFSSDNSSALDFLSGFAQASAVPVEQNAHHPVQPATSSDISEKLDTILSKIEDTMYKIEVLSGRVAQIEAQFRN